MSILTWVKKGDTLNVYSRKLKKEKEVKIIKDPCRGFNGYLEIQFTSKYFEQEVAVFIEEDQRWVAVYETYF